MKEELLHFIWKYKLFEYSNLVTLCGKKIELLNSGLYNENEGPDFASARIKIDELLWCGDIEIHWKTSDWNKHNHNANPNYKKVILHIVHHNDCEVTTSQIPILELKNYISQDLLNTYQKLFASQEQFIPCENHFAEIYTNINTTHFIEKLFVEKLWNNTKNINSLYKSLQNNWEHILFVRLAYCFGLSVNAEIFQHLAQNIPFSVVQKISQNHIQLESLFLGKANILSSQNSYARQLQQEYTYLQTKFQLNNIYFQPKFLRLRPANFPTIRLVQLANLYHKIPNLFSKIISIKNISEFYTLLEAIQVSQFWETHYTFDKKSEFLPKKLSKEFINLLILNAFIPVQFAYLQSLHKNTDSILEIAISLKSEQNNIVSSYKELGISVQNALESQAILQLYKHYCTPKKCLQCEIGLKILQCQT